MGRPGRLSRWARRLSSARRQDTSALSYAHVGLTYAGAVALYGLGGLWLDKKMGTEPLFTLLGVALGAVGGFLWVYREVTRAESQAKRDQDSEPK